MAFREQFVNRPVLSDPYVAATIIATPLTNSNTSVTASDLTYLPSTPQYRIRVENELMLVTAQTTPSAPNRDLTITRGIEGTTAVAHPTGSGLYVEWTALGLLNNPLALTTSGDMSYLDASLNQARLAIGANLSILGSNGTVPAWEAPTGTGSPVRGTAPTFTTSITVNGTATIGGTVADPFGTTPLNVQATNPSGNLIDIFAAGSGGSGGDPSVALFGARGTVASPAASQSGDKLGGMFFGGYGTSYNSTAAVNAYANQTFTGSAKGTYLVFGVTPDGSTSRVEALRVLGNGNIAIGNTAGSARLHAVSTTEQQRLGYDASNFSSDTISSVGSRTISVTGTNPSITLTPAGTGVVNLARTVLAAGAATAGAAPLKLTSGTNLTTAEAGALEYNGTNLFFTRTGTTRETVLVGVTGAAPSTSIGVGIVNYYGTSATNFLGDPVAWMLHTQGGTVYKIPLYT